MNQYARFLSQFKKSLEELEYWREKYGHFEEHASLGVSNEKLNKTFNKLVARMKGNYPFHHPSYAGQMLKPPHPAAWMAYSLAMTINPNNHALDGGPPSSEMEKEVVAKLAAMVGYGETYLGHLTSSGTLANLEALWVARQRHPGKAVAFSEDAHYTHGRMCDLLKIPKLVIPTDEYGRMDMDELHRKKDEVGTVVATMGTTGLGSIDPLAELLDWADGHDIRVHADAAYGGFFKLLETELSSKKHWQALNRCASIAIDPHKHGLQPYGCGCILFSNPETGKYYKHDSPYTYFTSDDLHLGEISLECSRAGASAVALWATLELLPLHSNTGLGEVLRAARYAANRFYESMEYSSRFRPIHEPALDIVGYFPVTTYMEASSISEASQKIFNYGMEQEKSEGFHLSLYRLKTERLKKIHSEIKADQEEIVVLRSVFMKPEHEDFVDELAKRLEKAYKKTM